MFYSFPTIRHINDVLPHLEGYPEILVADRGDHIVINYMVDTGLTFGAGSYGMKAVKGAKEFMTLDEGAAVRRECRGMIFNKETGALIRRPYHKFFNVNQREETQAHHIRLDLPHVMMEKLDGSSIAPYRVDKKAPFIWGTRMGDTEVAGPPTAFANARDNYVQFAEFCEMAGGTAIFEWCSPQQRIVIDHTEDKLILTAIRDLYTGEYIPYHIIKNLGDAYGIPVCGLLGEGYPVVRPDAADLVEFIRSLPMDEYGEGVVGRFENGHMFKIKLDEYVTIHHAKERITEERHVVSDITNGVLDDVLATVLDEDAERLRKYETKFWAGFYEYCDRLTGFIYGIPSQFNHDRKAFALSNKNHLTKFEIRAIFHFWDYQKFEGADFDETDIHKFVLNGRVKPALGARNKFGEMKDEVFPNVSFKY